MNFIKENLLKVRSNLRFHTHIPLRFIKVLSLIMRYVILQIAVVKEYTTYFNCQSQGTHEGIRRGNKADF